MVISPYRLRSIRAAWPRLAATLLLGMVPMPIAQAQTVAGAIKLHNQVSYTYDAVSSSDSTPQCGPASGLSLPGQGCISNATRIEGISAPVMTEVQGRLVDPLGQVTGCAGELLPDYTGFSVALYETNPADLTGSDLQGLVPLVQTAVPTPSGSNIPLGLAPNTQNSNPFYLTNGDQGKYNFLLDTQRGQLATGHTYILVVKPGNNSIYSTRRVRIAIGAQTGNQLAYTATSLDGKPISASDNRTTVSGVISIRDGSKTGLVLAAIDFNTSICQSQDIQIVKTGDRAAAEPGDTVIYRLSVRNLASAPIGDLMITDVLPLGFDFLPKSVRAELRGSAVPVTTTRNGSTVTFTVAGTTLPPATTDQTSVLNIAYAAQLTPDAVRGTGQNSAIVNGQRLDNHWSVKDGPAIHRLRIRAGILSDCGIIIGRVFVDKNFDGEQQPNEPGVPNAVIFLDDGTRITTDANGLFSIANVLPGYRTGVLDLSSLPGYTLAPNHRVLERNSQSRLVHLEPSGMVRMNFGVTPAFQGAVQP